MKKILAFVKNESGAVTVDWVVLTAAVVGLAVAVAAFLTPLGARLGTEITGAMTTVAGAE